MTGGVVLTNVFFAESASGCRSVGATSFGRSLSLEQPTVKAAATIHSTTQVARFMIDLKQTPAFSVAQ
jgi:hypothetical protein